MKRNLIYTGLALVSFALLMVTGCKKETTAVDTSAQYDAQLLISDADNAYNNTNVTEGTETTEFYAENEGLPEMYTITEEDMDSAGFKRTKEKRFFTCLKKLDLTDTQTKRIRMSVRAFEECKSADIRAHREAYAKLLTRIENLRKEYAAQLKNGKITKAQFEAKMKELRSDFETSLKVIKASYAKRLNACYEKFMRALKEVLTERQWKAFVDCYR
jgi:hypothetical protein